MFRYEVELGECDVEVTSKYSIPLAMHYNQRELKNGRALIFDSCFFLHVLGKMDIAITNESADVRSETYGGYKQENI